MTEDNTYLPLIPLRTPEDPDCLPTPETPGTVPEAAGIPEALQAAAPAKAAAIPAAPAEDVQASEDTLDKPSEAEEAPLEASEAQGMPDSVWGETPQAEQIPDPIPGQVGEEQTPEETPEIVIAPRPKADTDIWQQAARTQRRRRRWIGWTLVLCLALAVGLAIGKIFFGGTAAPAQDSDPSSPDGQEGASIVDIFDENRSTTIPRFTGDSAVRLTITSQRGEELTATQVYQKVNPAVVTVIAETNTGAFVGTGVIMTADGYIITNAHVISGGNSCHVALDTGRLYEARLVAYDDDEDLAVLKAMDAEDLPAAEFGDSDQLLVGETAYAIGNPLGVELRGTMTDGIISAVSRSVKVNNDTYMTMIQTTAALNNGNSGGPLINSSGQIVGINTMKMSNYAGDDLATVEGLGFALPISSACFVINDLIATGSFRGIPTIGISVVATEPENDEPSQVVVYAVDDGTGAQEAGIRAGDVVLAADGQEVHQITDLLAVRRTHTIDDTMVLTVERDGETMDIPVVLYSDREE